MAWTPLKTDFTDAVWAGLKKYTMVNNEDGSVSFNDVTVYTNRENSFFGAAEANAIDTAINIIMAMVENGTDLYTDFSTYFNTQKTAFQNRATTELTNFQTYLGNLETQANSEIAAIESGYSTRIVNFESAQQALFTQWFDMVKGQLSTDVAGNLQNQVTEVDERLSNLEYMVLQNDLTMPLAVDSAGTTILIDDDGTAIVAEWTYKQEG